jgi:hypothetical protein
LVSRLIRQRIDWAVLGELSSVGRTSSGSATTSG